MTKATIIPDRRNELYDRCSYKLLYTLIINDENNDETLYDLDSNKSNNLNEPIINNSTNLTSINNAINLNNGGLSHNINNNVTSLSHHHVNNDEPEYLLLDVRSEEDYKLRSIKSAVWFPLSSLRQDKMHPTLFSRKNKNCAIIVYEEHEKMAIEATEMLMGKGFKGLAVLTGGLAKFEEKYPELVLGSKVIKSLPPATANITAPSRKLNSSAGDKNETLTPLQALKKKVYSAHPELLENDTHSMMSGVSRFSTATRKSDLSSLKKKY